MEDKDIHSLENYNYELPEERIAKFPLEDRSASKLLVYQNGSIRHDHFYNLSQHLTKGHLLVFNNTQVIPARIFLQKETGAKIEVFLLEPIYPSKELNQVMETTTSCVWGCMVGNARKWKINTELKVSLHEETIRFKRIAEREVRISWDNASPFSKVLNELGRIPLPPYLNREAVKEDELRYQTIYSKAEGAVAAPTAGLHFTNRVLDELDQKGIHQEQLTLHVGAGTFQPVSTNNILEHRMHYEQISVSGSTIKQIRDHKQVVAVGTTSMRTLESIYWYGCLLEKDPESRFLIHKETAWSNQIQVLSVDRSLENILKYLASNKLNEIVGKTGIYIYPGYEPKICKGIITNFHLPKSSLILLISALVGEDWKKIYQTALDNNYRFLSYGDSSLLWF